MSCLSGSRTGVKLEAARVSWGRRHCREITFIADVSGNQSGKYFDLNAINSSGAEVKYYVLIDNGSAVDPAPAGKTKITVSITNGDSATAIALAAKTAIDLNANFIATIDADNSAKMCAKNAYVGLITEESSTGATGLTFIVEILGIGGDLGKTSGGISLNLEGQTFEVKADQTAEILLDEIMIGNSATLEMSLIELSLERWKTLIGSVSGNFYEPLSGTELIGFGESKLYKSMLDYSGELVLHPIRLDDADKSEDVIFWLCAPIPSSINYSGTEQQALEISFKAYLDSTKPKEINLFAIGDHTQITLA
jgi:hypothetical protein